MGFILVVSYPGELDVGDIRETKQECMGDLIELINDNNLFDVGWYLDLLFSEYSRDIYHLHDEIVGVPWTKVPEEFKSYFWMMKYLTFKKSKTYLVDGKIRPSIKKNIASMQKVIDLVDSETDSMTYKIKEV